MTTTMPMQYYFREFTYDSEQCKLWFKSKEIKITKRQNNLLHFFLQNENKVVSKGELIEHVWHGRIVTSNTIDQNILKLRNLLNEIQAGEYLQSVYGLGIRFLPEVKTNLTHKSFSKRHKLALIFAGVILFCIPGYFYYVSIKPDETGLTRLNLDIKHDSINNKHSMNNWLIYAGGRYLTNLLFQYEDFDSINYKQDLLTSASYNILTLQFNANDDVHHSLHIDFNNSLQGYYVAQLTDDDFQEEKTHLIKANDINVLFAEISQWIVVTYADDVKKKQNIEQVFSSDEYALESYFRAMQAQQQGDAEQALVYLQAATKKDAEFKYAWYESAVAYRNKGDPRKALSILSVIDTQHLLLKYQVILVSAQCYDVTMNFDKAKKLYQQAYELALDFQQPAKQATVLISQAIMYRKLKQYDLAEEALKTALSLIGSETHPYLFGTLSNTYANLAREQHNYQSAIKHSLLAIAAFQKVGNSRYANNAKTVLSSILLIRNEFKSAKRWINESLFYAQEVNYLRGISDNKTKLAMIYQKTGRFDLAIKTWNAVIDLTDQLELPGNKAQANLWLIKLYLHKNKIDLATIHLKTIEQIYTEEPRKSIKNLWLHAKVLVAIKSSEIDGLVSLLVDLEESDIPLNLLLRGDIAYAQNKYQLAENYYLQYYQHYAASGKFDVLVTVLNRLSQLYITTNSNKLIANIAKTTAFNPPIYPYYVFKARLSYMQDKQIEAKSLIQEVKIKSKDLWQITDELIYKKIQETKEIQS